MNASKASSEPELERAEPNHLPALDGLRGLAILLVLLRHFGVAAGGGQAWWTGGVAEISNFGYIGVDLFFVLSGFLITGILYRTLPDRRYFTNFYMRRFLRIFPLYYGYLFLLLVLTRPLNIAWNGDLPVFLSYMQNIFIVRPYTMLWYYTGQLWSLAVEEQFYILWPLLIFLIRDRRRLMGSALILSLAALICKGVMAEGGISGALIYRLTPCRMDSLLIGSWVALATRGPSRLRILRVARPTFLVCSFLYVFIALPAVSNLPHLSHILSNAAYSIVAIGFAALLVMSLNSRSFTSRLCRWNVLRWLGKYSYGIYVIHLAVGHLVNGALGRWSVANGVARGEFGYSLTVAMVSISLSLFLAWISYNFYEVHFLKLKKYFSYDRQPHQPVIVG